MVITIGIMISNGINIIILLHDWEGNTGEYSVRGWQYWPDRREGQYIARELNIPCIVKKMPYCRAIRPHIALLLTNQIAI